MYQTPEEWMATYNKMGALWVHDGNPKRPHALLSKDNMHSSGFFNSELVMEDPLVLDHACADLHELLVAHKVRISGIDRVVGPAMGAITLAHHLAFRIAMERGYPCLRAYTEKKMLNGKEIMVFDRTTLKQSEHILLGEDVVTSAGSVELAADAVREAGGIVMPFVAVLVNRSGMKKTKGKPIIALIDHPMPKWDPEKDECPLCKVGSEALHPKQKDNWKRLNAVYPQGEE